MKKILVLLLIALSFCSCEKDDICSEETTPRLVIEFYDISNPASLKTVLNLKVREVGQTVDLGTFNSVSKIKLPLKIADTTTKYSFILNSTGTTVPPNEDFLEFNYTTQNVFLSRACGYKTIFTLDNVPTGVVKSDVTTPNNFWIQDINIQTNAITTENGTHIKIYF